MTKMQKPKQNTAQETAVEDALTLVNGLELPYLIELAERLSDHIETRRKADIQEARRRIAQIAAGLGMPVDAIIATPVSGIKGLNPARYRNPHDPQLTWSGMGRRPAWITALEAEGYTLDQLRIEGGGE